MLEFLSDGVRIAYLDFPPEGAAGQTDRHKTPVLLIHGFASNHGVNWLFPQWVKTLTQAGRRVIVFDNRGHGRSEKLYEPEAYRPQTMAGDAARLLDHLGIARADVMGYSMGGRIAAHLALAAPEKIRGLILAGIGIHLIDDDGPPSGVAEAMEASSLEDLTDPKQRMFRAFADSTRSDRRALAACIRGSRRAMTVEEIGAVAQPTLICVGSEDDIAGDPLALAALMRDARALVIPGRDHNRAVGDKLFKEGVLAFLESLQPAV
ncbi:alpha/beta hydrolase [Rhodoblastus sphagnicola]|uniref:Alpha/beta hydrolase n=2 Tax=Rhodoblastus sphagnicola TaxID=333368 RepID=A0A2S6MYP8_9HYPH|nr:alpha/beta hydrolase [Rhodoblastus sphagnicola]PPQ27487.1 alpha/beta hydrolase [Rhodoblastus sphagnicola]